MPSTCHVKGGLPGPTNPRGTAAENTTLPGAMGTLPGKCRSGRGAPPVAWRRITVFPPAVMPTQWIFNVTGRQSRKSCQSLVLPVNVAVYAFPPAYGSR